MNTFIIQVEGAGFYQGHNILINGLQVAHRPYDGSHLDAVEREVAEAFGELLRKEMGLKKEAPPEEEDW